MWGILNKAGKSLPARRVIRWIGMIFSSSLFFWLLSQQDWKVISRNLSAIPLWVIPILLLLYYSGMTINALRWYILLRAQKVKTPFLKVMRIVFAGSFASNFLPSTIGGDAVRVFGIQQLVGNWAISTASIFVDRLLNVLAMVVSSPFSVVTFGPGLLHLFDSGGISAPAIAFALPVRGSRWKDFWKQMWLPVKESVNLWWNHPWYLILAFVLSWLSVFVVFVAVWWIALLLGIQVGLHQVIGVNVITYLLTLIPISFNGYGVREFAMASLYMKLGASSDQASMLALITRFFMMVETLPGALWLSQVAHGVAQSSRVEEQK